MIEKEQKLETDLVECTRSMMEDLGMKSYVVSLDVCYITLTVTPKKIPKPKT